VGGKLVGAEEMRSSRWVWTELSKAIRTWGRGGEKRKRKEKEERLDFTASAGSNIEGCR